MKVTFVGTGDAFGSGGRLQTCILIEGTTTTFTIDFGASSLIGMRREEIDPNSIDLILLTHLHGDHCGGIPFLLLDAMLGSKRSNPLTIVGPRGTKEHLQRVQEALFPGSHVMEPKFELHYNEINPNHRLEVADLAIDSVEARHTRETNPLAVCVTSGDKRIAYTGDGELTDELAQLVNGVDLLIAESYFYDKAVPWHLNYPDLEHLEAKRVVLTHMHSNMLEQADKVPEECAYDGYVITI
jgi:ribonuclease BN (tRNA processing enzyme)